MHLRLPHMQDDWVMEQIREGSKLVRNPPARVVQRIYHRILAQTDNCHYRCQETQFSGKQRVNVDCQAYIECFSHGLMER